MTQNKHGETVAEIKCVDFSIPEVLRKAATPIAEDSRPQLWIISGCSNFINQALFTVDDFSVIGTVDSKDALLAFTKGTIALPPKFVILHTGRFPSAMYRTLANKLDELKIPFGVTVDNSRQSENLIHTYPGAKAIGSLQQLLNAARVCAGIEAEYWLTKTEIRG
jgi:hypothetical protein